MPTTVALLRSYGERHVVLETANGPLAGRIVAHLLSDAAVVVMFATDADPAQPLVVALDDIEGIVER